MKVSGFKLAEVLNKKREGGFTLIEILVVMTIIGILMALVIGVAGPVQQQARVYRAKGEIAGIETALTRFETDNGFVPTSVAIGINGGTYAGDPGDNYIKASKALFLALTGRHYYWTVSTNVGPNYYTSMKQSQVYNPNPNPTEGSARSDDFSTYESTAVESGDYLMDPWGNPYGFYYATNSTNHSLFNQVTYDLWTTSGETNNPGGTNDAVMKRWKANWPNE
jgi:prepilin-type N-terminal cleavage/methylation domain-containing protein